MKIGIHKQWRWLAIDQDGIGSFHLTRPKREWSVGRYWKHPWNEASDLIDDLPIGFSLYKRHGNNWRQVKV